MRLDATHKYKMNRHLTTCRGTSKAVKLKNYQRTKLEQTMFDSKHGGICMCLDAMGENNAISTA
jgi:hypothetical protein